MKHKRILRSRNNAEKKKQNRADSSLSDLLCPLVRKMQTEAASEEVFREICRLSRPVFYKEAAAFFTSSWDIEDALQETYLRIWSRLDSLNNPRLFLAWGLKITRRTCINMIAQRDRRSGKEELCRNEETITKDVSRVIALSDHSISRNPEKYTEYLETLQEAETAVNALAGRQRAALMLRLEGRSYREIGALLGVPEGTARRRVCEARRAVRTSLEEQDRK